MLTKVARTTVRFGPYQADFAQGELRKHGTRLKIQGKPLAILELLVNRQGEIVSRDELRNALWPEDVFVDFEKNLSTAVNKLRVVLNDSAESPRFIETIPRRGYRFLVPVEMDGGAEAALSKQPGSRAVEGGQAIAVSEPNGSTVAALEPVKGSVPVQRHWLFRVGAAVGGAAGISLLLASAFWPGNAKSKFNETDTIVLGDFQNSTGNPVFDNTLRQGLASQLDQSPYLNVLSDARIQQTLALMAKPRGTGLSSEIVRDVCVRAGSKVYVAGAIGSLGKEYVVELKAMNCENGDTLAEEQVTAGSKDEVVSALGKAATGLRKALGESLITVQRFNVPLDQATTSSLEALKAYTLGQKAAHERGAAQSLPYEQQAIAIDPNFAMAYEAVGMHYTNLGEPSRADEYLSKAFNLRDRTSERERLRIAASYYTTVTGELDKAAETYRDLSTDYPRDIAAYNNLGIVRAEQGRYQEAADITRQGIRVAPEEITLQENLTGYLLALQRFEDAGRIIDEAQPKKPDNYVFPAARYVLGFLASDSNAMLEQQEWFSSRPLYNNFGLALASDTAAYVGQLGKARELTSRAVESAVQADARETGAIWEAIGSQREAAYGFHAEGRRSAGEALRLAPASQGTQAEAALALALAGDAKRAESLARDLERKSLRDTQVQSLWLPAIRAQLELNRRNPDAALKALQIASPPLEFGTVAFSANASGSCLYPTYIRGQAYLDAGQGAAATAEFKKILDRGGIVWNCWTGTLARLGIARANALQARTAQGADADAARVRALAAYKQFLELWTDSDPDIPIVKQAKTEYVKLQ